MKRRLSLHGRETLVAWLLLSPALAGFLIFYLIPFGESVWCSLISDMFRKQFVGLDNYARLLGNPTFLQGMGNTLLFNLMGVPLSTGGGLALALAFRHVTRGAAFWKTALLAALVLPAASVAGMWNALFTQRGILNGWIVSLSGEPVGFLTTDMARIVILLLYLWRNLGYHMVIFSAGLAAIPREYEEIARTEGADAWQRFWYVTLPCLKGSVFFVVLLSLMGGFKVFREVYAIAGAYPQESIYLLQSFLNNLFTRLDYQSLCAAAVATVFVTLAPVTLYLRSLKEDRS